MLSQIPLNLDEIDAKKIDRELLRAAMIAELDAVNLYEQCAASVQDDNLKIVFKDIIKEEKTHIGEFQALLLMRDLEQAEELTHGDKEVDDLTASASEDED